MPIRWVERDNLRPYVPPPTPPERTVEQLAAIYRIRTLQKVRQGMRPPERRPRRGAKTAPEEPAPAPASPPGPSPEPAPRHPAITASEILAASVVTASPDDPVATPLGLFERRGFRHLPVVGEDGTLVGILSERDLLRARALPGPSTELRVRDLMRFPVLTASPDTPIRELAHAMVAERIGCLPIVDDRGILAGIVTTTDILRCVASTRPLNLWA